MKNEQKTKCNSVSKPLRDILNINEFKADQDDIKQVFPRAYALPEFFLHHLFSPHRVVKYFTGPTALVQAFYYQLMKLALEVEVEHKNYRDVVMQNLIRYECIEEGELRDQLFSDFQYRKFLKDFIQIVQSDNVPSFQVHAEEYPIIDQILRKMFEVLVPYPLIIAVQNKQKDAVRHLLFFLAQKFDITLAYVQPCFKFQQSDTFIYFQNFDQVYLAFDDEFMDQPSGKFTSTFQCGEGNSFATKYKGSETSRDNGRKKFEKSQYWKDNEKSSESMLNNAKKALRMEVKHISYNSRKENMQEKIQYGQKTQIPKRSNGTVSPLSLNGLNVKVVPLEQQQKQKLYSEFSSTFIVEQLSPRHKEQVQNIKSRYRPHRNPTRNFI